MRCHLIWKYKRSSADSFVVWPAPEEHNSALFGAPPEAGSSTIVQYQLKTDMEVNSKTVREADPDPDGEWSVPETDSVEAQILSSWVLRGRETGGFGHGVPCLWCCPGHVLKMPFWLMAKHMMNSLVQNGQVIQKCRVKEFQDIIQQSLAVRQRQMEAELEKYNLGKKLPRSDSTKVELIQWNSTTNQMEGKKSQHQRNQWLEKSTQRHKGIASTKK